LVKSASQHSNDRITPSSSTSARSHSPTVTTQDSSQLNSARSRHPIWLTCYRKGWTRVT